jgi:hypothetical protein
MTTNIYSQKTIDWNASFKYLKEITTFKNTPKEFKKDSLGRKVAKKAITAPEQATLIYIYKTVFSKAKGKELSLSLVSTHGSFASQLNCSVRTMQRYINKLVKYGFLEKTRVCVGKGKETTDRIKLTIKEAYIRFVETVQEKKNFALSMLAKLNEKLQKQKSEKQPKTASQIEAEEKLRRYNEQIKIMQHSENKRANKPNSIGNIFSKLFQRNE